MIPNKSTFKFQELTPITGVKPYVLRFWETEFAEINPVVSDSGQKLYARKDVEAILRIKKLLFEEKMSIPEARATLENQEIDIGSRSLSPKSAAPSKNDVISQVGQAIEDSLRLINEIKSKRNW